MPETIAHQVLQIVRDAGMVRARDLSAQGISPTHLQRLYEQGFLQRSGRGVYLPLEETFNENTTLAEVALRVPAGVICLLSALQFHGLTTQLPHQVWLALPLRANIPRMDYPPIRVVHLSGEAQIAGIEQKHIGRVTVGIYSPAKTVADCFKFRNKIGLDVAIEGLRDCWNKQQATIDELWRYAKICRVANIMRPYLESIAV